MRGSAAGFTEWLLFHLWKQNERTGESCPFVLVPDTIIYRWGRPFFWYFTTHAGELLRKSKNKVSHKFIEQDFLATQHMSEMVCQYLSFQNEGKSDASSKATMHFFTRESFCNLHAADFILNREKSLSGLLQKWIEPKGGHNCTPYSALIKVTWSPLFSVMERRTNKFLLSDSSIDFYDRLATYEGFEFNSDAESLAVPQLVADLRKICAAMVEHIRSVSGGNISVTRLVIYFKQDENDRLWFLFCGGVQIYDLENSQSKGPDSELQLELPPLAISKHLPGGKPYFELQRNRLLCPSCNLFVRTSELCPVSFELLVECCEQGLDCPPNYVRAEGEVEKGNDESVEHANGEVPRVIRRTVGGVTNSRYKTLRENVKWLMSKTKVCESCYLYYTGLRLYGPPKSTAVPIPSRRAESQLSLDDFMRKLESYRPTPDLQKPALETHSQTPVSQLQSSERQKSATPYPVQHSPTPYQSSLQSRRLTPTTEMRGKINSYPVTKREMKVKKKEEEGERLRIEGRFTARRLPEMMNIYTGRRTPMEQSHSTRASSQASNLRLRDLPPVRQQDILTSTIRSLKMCLLDGVLP